MVFCVSVVSVTTSSLSLLFLGPLFSLVSLARGLLILVFQKKKKKKNPALSFIEFFYYFFNLYYLFTL